MNDDAVQDVLNPLAGFDFRVAKPSLQQKEWMVKMIVQNSETAASIARNYHFNRKYLHKMVRRTLRGIPVRFQRGRPRVIDEQSHSVISASVDDNICVTLLELNQSIGEEFKATHDRRYENISGGIDADGSAVKISRRSLKRYIHRFHPGVFLAAPPAPLPFEEPFLYWL